LRIGADAPVLDVGAVLAADDGGVRLRTTRKLTGMPGAADGTKISRASDRPSRVFAASSVLCGTRVRRRNTAFGFASMKG